VLEPPGPEELPEPPALRLWDESDPHGLWWLGREWSGYPELEWTPAIFPDRVHALSGHVKLLFYEQITDFDTARYLIRMGTLMRSRREPSYPSVSLGFVYFDDAYYVTDGRLRLPAEGERPRGRHYVATVDSEDVNELAFVNTWGPRWGNNGHGAITREYFDAHVDAVLTRWSAVAGPSFAYIDCLNRLETRRIPLSEQRPHCWPTPNSDFQTEEIWVRGYRHDLLTWKVISMSTRRVVYVYEVRNALRIIGRAHLFFEFGETDSAILRELFVLPAFRRRGYGSLLEEIATERAVVSSLSRIEIWLHEGDARERVRPAAEQFAISRGYSWADVSMTRPNIVAIATKELS
jgi:GNAT superfamily N-acetyltransferase